MHRSQQRALTSMLATDGGSVAATIFMARRHPQTAIQASAVVAVATWAVAAVSVATAIRGADRRLTGRACLVGGAVHSIACVALAGIGRGGLATVVPLASAIAGGVMTAGYLSLLDG